MSKATKNKRRTVEHIKIIDNKYIRIQPNQTGWRVFYYEEIKPADTSSCIVWNNCPQE